VQATQLLPDFLYPDAQVHTVLLFDEHARDTTLPVPQEEQATHFPFFK
jgi:hypothetical protein